MVRSKEVPKKPKDLLLTPPSKRRGSLRDDDRGGSVPWNRGGVAMSPAPASVPNYMRGTSSSDAKTGQRAVVPSSASPTTRWPIRVAMRGKVLFPDVPGMSRATCSSTMKEAKFPSELDLAPGATDAEGPAAMRVCPYTYCSLNGHAHAPAVPLRSFLASRRRLIKTQQSMKLKGVSAFRGGSGHQRPEDKNIGGARVAPLMDEEALGDYFVEVYTGPRVSSDMSCSDMSLDEMEATVRRMEFVVFDRCGGDEDSEKGNNIGVCGEGEGRLENRLAVCRESTSECSDAAISGNLVEELPWMRYQGYEYDSLDDEVSEEQGQGVVDEEIRSFKVSDEQEGKDEVGTSRELGDESKEEADKELEPKDEESISDFPSEKGIITEEESADGEARHEGNIIWDTMHAHEISIEEEPHHLIHDEESITDAALKMQITAEQTEEEKLFDGVCKSEIPKYEVVGRVENILEGGCKEDDSVNREVKFDVTNVESTGKLRVTEEVGAMYEEHILDDGSEMETSETVSCVESKEDFSEEEVTSEAVSEGEISEFSLIGSPDVEIVKQPTNGGFKQDVDTVEDAFEHDDIPTGNTVGGTKDAQKESEITACKLEDASEESGIAKQSSNSANSLCVAAAAAEMEPEITKCKSEDSSEESGIAPESSQRDRSAYVRDDAQYTTCKSGDASNESGIAQETVHDDNPAYLVEGAQVQLGADTNELENTSEESGIAHEFFEASNSAYDSDDAPRDLSTTTCKLRDPSQEFVTLQEADQDHNFTDVSGDAQSESCELADASEESDIAQEATRDDNTGDVNDGAQKESKIITSESEHAREESNITQEWDDSDYTAGAKKESQITSELEDGCEEVCITEEANLSPIVKLDEHNYEESDIAQEATRDDNTGDVNDDAQKESKIITSESEHAREESNITQEWDDSDYTAGTKKEPQITSELADGCEEVCITEEANLSPIFKLDEHNYDFSVTDGYGEPQNLPAKDTDKKEFSIHDMCNVFSEMNLTGDVYIDPTESAICPRNRLIIARRRRTPEEEEYMRGFNPRAPNFLPLELDPDAEKVDLKHQMTEDRKNAEEWMIDYALRRAVNNLGPARKKKVELLVQAFETVLPHDAADKKSITPTRSAQACN